MITTTDRVNAALEIKVPEGWSEVDQFALLLAAGVNAWRQAGELLVKMLNTDKNFMRKIRQAHPEISQDMLLVFERIGRNQLVPMLLVDGSPGAKALAQLPYSEQEKYTKEPIPVVVYDSGQRKVRMCLVSEITAAQVKYVFSDDRVLSVQEQEVRRKGLYPKRFDEKPLLVVETAKPARKTVEKLGCYTVKVGRDGAITFTPTKESFRAQQVRVERPPSSAGAFSGEILFYHNL